MSLNVYNIPKPIYYLNDSIKCITTAHIDVEELHNYVLRNVVEDIAQHIEDYGEVLYDIIKFDFRYTFLNLDIDENGKSYFIGLKNSDFDFTMESCKEMYDYTMLELMNFEKEYNIFSSKDKESIARIIERNLEFQKIRSEITSGEIEPNYRAILSAIKQNISEFEDKLNDYGNLKHKRSRSKGMSL